MFLTVRIVGSSPTWAKIKNPVERRDFCFVLFNIYHSLNAHDSNEMHLSDIFEKFVLNKAQLNILMSRV